MENKKRLLHNFDTTLMRYEFIVAIRYDAERNGGRQIQEGTFTPPTSTPKYMTKVITHFRMPQVARDRRSILTTILTEEYI